MRTLQVFAELTRTQDPSVRGSSTLDNSDLQMTHTGFSNLTSDPALPLLLFPPPPSLFSFSSFLSSFNPTRFLTSSDNAHPRNLDHLSSNTATNASTNPATSATTMSSGAALIFPGPSQPTYSLPIIGSAFAHNSQSLSPGAMDDQPLDLSRQGSASATSKRQPSVVNDVPPPTFAIFTTLVAQALKDSSAGFFNLFRNDAVSLTSLAISNFQDASQQQNGNLSYNFLVKSNSAATQESSYKPDEGEQRSPQIRRRVCDKPRSRMSCHVCNAKFGSRAELNSHTVESHGGWKCSICPKHFKQFGNLGRHMLSHLSMKAYRCNLCGVRYTRRDHLTRHGREKHKAISPAAYIQELFSTSKYTELLKTTPLEEVSQRLALEMEGTPTFGITKPSSATSNCPRSDEIVS